MKSFKYWPFWLRVGIVFSLVDLFFMLALLFIPMLRGGDPWDFVFFVYSLLTQPLVLGMGLILGYLEIFDVELFFKGAAVLGTILFIIVGTSGWFILGCIIGLLLRGKLKTAIEKWPLWLSFGIASVLIGLGAVLFFYFGDVEAGPIIITLSVLFAFGAAIGFVIQFIRNKFKKLR